ncbi:pentatricopeptide repeat-containing protein At1g80270, mitochondrial-like [Euphorbia lathyris]|uniref:pentatricopeptide repeat-containing protein At1g80270, mitochondrial-like n=1 Tax=Euphorbia lathyris TaxID=212925 RepID=UPI003313E014
MWALRRASNQLRLRSLNVGISRVSFAKLEISEAESGVISDSSQASLERCLFNQTKNVCSNIFMGGRSLSSQAGAETSESDSEDDLEDGFSELESPADVDKIEVNNAPAGNEEELVSEPELSDDEDDDDDVVSQLEKADSGEKIQKRKTSELFQAILSANVPVSNVLDKWVEEGKTLDRSVISLAMFSLRKRRMYGKALQLSEWLETSKQLDFIERDYASRLDLISKVRGLQKAEQYLEKVPKSFREEVIYRTLLASCVSAGNLKKAEEVFNKMKDLEFPITVFACNQLLLLYKRLDKKKIANVLLLMEKESVKPSLFTYKILIDTKGQSNDLTGMDQIVETMKAEGIEPDVNTLAIMARHYVSGGLKDKAEAILKEMEGGNLKEHRWACKSLLPLYAQLGKVEEVGRVWKACESKPRIDECVAAIEAWGKVNKIDEAEAVFERMRTTWKKLNSKQYSALLKVYASHKMLTKGKELIKQMADSGCRIGPLTWDALVKLYVEAGEVEKADSMLQKAAQQNQMKPMFSSYMSIMDQYAKRGDIHNAEKIFHRMRQAGYVARQRQFQALVVTYINAKSPAYGIRDRMKADNIFPSKGLAGQLAQVDAFRKTAVSDLLD